MPNTDFKGTTEGPSCTVQGIFSHANYRFFIISITVYEAPPTKKGGKEEKITWRDAFWTEGGLLWGINIHVHLLSFHISQLHPHLW